MLYFSSEWFPALFHNASKRVRRRDTGATDAQQSAQIALSRQPAPRRGRAKRVMVEHSCNDKQLVNRMYDYDGLVGYQPLSAVQHEVSREF